MSDALMRFSAGARRGATDTLCAASSCLACGGAGRAAADSAAWPAVALATLVLLASGLGLARTAAMTASGAGSIRSVSFAGLLPGAIVAPVGLALCGVTLVLLYRTQLARQVVTASVPARQ
jgi:hypothetical protein